MADTYIIRVTAGPSYDPKTHIEVRVNEPKPLNIQHPLMDIELNVRIKDYFGLPFGSPTTSPYFSLEPHITNDDTYAISLKFTPKAPTANHRDNSNTTSASINSTSHSDSDSEYNTETPANGILGTDLQFGNDFPHPIRDRLPPGFSYALNIVKWWIDPGLDGDPYSDTPYLYGPAISSFNTVHVGEGEYSESKGGLWFEEGGNKAGMIRRDELAIPTARKERMKWALIPRNKESWVWEWNKTYGADFFNAYLDFTELALRLPGYNFPLMSYIDSGSVTRRSHQLRYVLRNRITGDPYLVIVFSLHLREDITQNRRLKEKDSVQSLANESYENGLATQVSTLHIEKQQKANDASIKQDTASEESGVEYEMH